MLTQVTICPIEPRQAPLLAELHQFSFGASAWTLRQIEDSLKLNSTAGFTAINNEEPVGFILVQQSNDEAEILTFCVHPNKQRQKIGERLLQETIKAAMNKKCVKLFLEVAADNSAANNLYAKLGFQIIGKRPGYYQRGNTRIDALTFALPLFA